MLLDYLLDSLGDSGLLAEEFLTRALSDEISWLDSDLPFYVGLELPGLYGILLDPIETGV